MNISAFAKAWFAFIGAADLGQGIRQSSDYLQPVMDITNLLALSRRRVISAGNVNMSAGTNFPAGFTVPDNETWILRHAYFEVTTGGVDTSIGSTLILVTPSGAGAGILSLTGGVSPAINSRSTAVFTPPFFILEAKSQIGVRGGTVTGTPTFNLGALVEVIGGI